MLAHSCRTVFWEGKALRPSQTLPSHFSFLFSINKNKQKQKIDTEFMGPGGRSWGSRHFACRLGLHAHRRALLNGGRSLHPFSASSSAGREDENRFCLCVGEQPSERQKRGEIKWADGETRVKGRDGGGGGVPRPLILAHFHRDWVTQTVPTHTHTHSARHRGFPAERAQKRLQVYTYLYVDRNNIQLYLFN